MTQEGLTDSEQEMLKYVRYSVLGATVFIIFMGIPVLFAVALLFCIQGKNSIPVLLMCWLLDLWMLYSLFTPFREYKKMTSYLKDSGIYYEAVTDFSSAQSFLNDNIRLGGKYIFGKNSCTVIRYADICRLYQEVVSANDTERSRHLMALDTSGKKWILCALDVQDENQPGLSDVLSFLQGRNSRIVIG